MGNSSYAGCWKNSFKAINESFKIQDPRPFYLLGR